MEQVYRMIVEPDEKNTITDYPLLIVEVYLTEQDAANNVSKGEIQAYFNWQNKPASTLIPYELFYVYTVNSNGTKSKIYDSRDYYNGAGGEKTGEGVSVNREPKFLTQQIIWLHDSDGNRTYTIGADVVVNLGSYSNHNDVLTYTGRETFTFPQIPKGAYLLTAPNFTDEENPTITFNNKAGNSVSSLQAAISFDGSTYNITRNITNKTSSSYTFVLTDAERQLIDNKYLVNNGGDIYFILKTVLGSNTYTSRLKRTITIVREEATFTWAVEDINTETVDLTGNANRLIGYKSNARLTITGVDGTKGAKITSIEVINERDRQVSTSSTFTGTFYAVGSRYFQVSTTSNTGLKRVQKIEVPDFLNYIPVSANIASTMIDVSGKAQITISGKFFNEDFKENTPNSLLVSYRYKADNENYDGSITVPSASIIRSDNTYEASFTLQGLDYRRAYTFQAWAGDTFGDVLSAEIIVKSDPVFDWGEHDFNFNVPVQFSAGVAPIEINSTTDNPLDLNDYTDVGLYYVSSRTALKHQPQTSRTSTAILIVLDGGGEGQIEQTYRLCAKEDAYEWRRAYYQGGWGPWTAINYQKGTRLIHELSDPWYMQASQALSFEDELALSHQPSGYIFVWSSYSDSVANDSEFIYSYVPKVHVLNDISNGATLTMPMAQANGTAGAKTLTISETALGGTNTDGEEQYLYTTTIRGNAANSTAPNNKYALRYILGY